MHPLVQLGEEKFNSKDSKAHVLQLAESKEANELLNDLDNYPHAFVLACCMDRQIKADRAWMIPYAIKEKLCPSFSIEALSQIPLKEYKRVFNENNLHRFNDTMAEVFFDGVCRIKNEYGGDASLIWRGKPSSATVVYHFLQFKGMGVKIATMAANLLVRLYRVEFSDYYSIDVSPDVHVRRVMKRLGLIDDEKAVDQIIYKARELNPVFPGIIDDPLWEIGRETCKAKKPNCEQCRLRSACEYCLRKRSN